MKLEEARELLPWYAAGALDDEEARQVEALLRAQPELDRELAEWRALESVVAEVATEEPAFRPELLADAHRRIDAYEKTRAAASPAPAAKPIASPRRETAKPRVTTAQAWLERIFGVWDATPFAARVAVAAQFAVLAVLVGILGTQWAGERSGTTLSGSRATFEGPHVDVVFRPERTLAEIEALLDDIGAQIVSGPTSQGLYVLALGDVDEAQAAATVEALRGNTAVVQYAARVEP